MTINERRAKVHFFTNKRRDHCAVLDLMSSFQYETIIFLRFETDLLKHRVLPILNAAKYVQNYL